MSGSATGRSVLFDQALLAEGAQLEDPAGFVRRVNALMLELSQGAAPAASTSGSATAGSPG